jgi:hypothetical protein
MDEGRAIAERWVFGDRDLAVLVDMAGVCPLPCGYQVVIRAEWTDRTKNVPHGLSYALILQDPKGDRVVGYDNSHGYDGAGDQEPFDHEHRLGLLGQRFRYNFTFGGKLITDFSERCKAACRSHKVPFEFDDTGCQP